MSGIALAGSVRALKKGDVKTVFWYSKIFLAFLMPPAAVALELHSFDSISIAIVVVALILWLFGWFPGVAFALFIILSSSGKKRVMEWFKSKPKPADAEAGTAKPAAAAAAAPAKPAAAAAAAPAKPAAAAPTAPAKPEAKAAAPAPAAAAKAPAAADAAKAPASAAPAAAKAPAPSGGGGWFGGGVNA